MDQQIPIEQIKDVSKNLLVYSNGIWKCQPHLLFLYELCSRQCVWFMYHIQKIQDEGSTETNGFKFKLVSKGN